MGFEHNAPSQDQPNRRSGRYASQAPTLEPTLSIKIGYLLPTRENILAQRPQTRPLLDCAREAADLGYDSLWAGDSLLARPRHDPLTLLAAVTAAVPDITVGTAVLLPALRNPVVLAQQLATLDQLSEGRLIIGAGIAADVPPVRAEFEAAGVPFEKRVGRMMEGFRLCRALWRGEPVDWQGRWTLKAGTLAPVPYRTEGPPVWIGTAAPAGIERTARHYDGWFPIGPDVETFSQRRAHFLNTATAAGRSTESLTTAIYLTVAVMEDATAAERAIDDYLAQYYGMPAALLRQVQACKGGTLGDVITFIRSFVAAGAGHVVLRLVGDHKKTLNQLSAHRDELGP